MAPNVVQHVPHPNQGTHPTSSNAEYTLPQTKSQVSSLCMLMPDIECRRNQPCRMQNCHKPQDRPATISINPGELSHAVFSVRSPCQSSKVKHMSRWPCVQKRTACTQAGNHTIHASRQSHSPRPAIKSASTCTVHSETSPANSLNSRSQCSGVSDSLVQTLSMPPKASPCPEHPVPAPNPPYTQ